jgi:hypothetical protein
MLDPARHGTMKDVSGSVSLSQLGFPRLAAWLFPGTWRALLTLSARLALFDPFYAVNSLFGRRTSFY